jgi:hypothetical protein
VYSYGQDESYSEPTGKINLGKEVTDFTSSLKI